MANSRVFSVSEINNYIKNIIENDIILNHIYVKGEISNFKLHNSGHMYFTLKDTYSKLKCVMFKTNCLNLKFMPEDGMEVVVMGYISIFNRDGQYQMYAESIIPEGVGALYKAFEQLKKKLELEGLFNKASKKKIPMFPKTVGVITSPTGAVLKDITSIIKRRNPCISIILYPVHVQGDSAVAEICSGIGYFNNNLNVDVIIVGRGGGTIEELWAFNEEALARVIYKSKIPIISAVGHETDYTICDFVSDMRAPTPSAAAEIVSPEKSKLLSDIAQMQYRLNREFREYLNIKRKRIENIYKANVFRQLEKKILDLRQSIDLMEKYLHNNMSYNINQKRNSVLNIIEKLNILNPASALLRGYACIERIENRKLVSSITQLQEGDKVYIKLNDGKACANIDYLCEENN